MRAGKPALCHFWTKLAEVPPIAVRENASQKALMTAMMQALAQFLGAGRRQVAPVIGAGESWTMLTLGLAILIGSAGGFGIRWVTPAKLWGKLLAAWILAPAIGLTAWAALSPSGMFGGWTWLVALLYAALPLSLWAAGSVAGFIAGRQLPR